MLTEALQSTYNRSGFGPFKGFWHATEAINCPRALLHRAYGHEAKPQYSNPAVMEDGLLHEHDMIRRLDAAGNPPQYVQCWFKTDFPPLITTPDGIYLQRNELFEIKTMNHDLFTETQYKGISVSAPEYIKQVNLRIWIIAHAVENAEGTNLRPELDHTRFLCKDRNTAEYYEEEVPYREDIVEPIIETVLTAVDLVEAKAPVEALPCSSDFLTRLWCPYRYLDEPIPEEMINESLYQAIEQWYKAKELESEASSVLTQLRNVMQQVILATGESDVFCNGLRLKLSTERRRSTDFDLARELLAPDLYTQIISERQVGPLLRIFRSKK